MNAKISLFVICVEVIICLLLYNFRDCIFNLIFSLKYHWNRNQRVKIKIIYRDESNIEFGVPQGSILAPLLINIDLIDFFIECYDSEIESYADDINLYSCADDMSSVITQLQSTASKLLSWFTNNHMKDNPGKCRFLLRTKKGDVLRLARVKSFSES